MPSLTRSLRRLVEGEKQWNFKIGDIVERGWTPGAVPPPIRSDAESALIEFEKYLAPVDRQWLAGRIMALRAHYWTPDMPDMVRTAAAMDWIAVLSDLPRHAIEAACLEWLKTQKWGPKPSEILDLAKVIVGDAMRQRDRLRMCLDYQPGHVGRRRAAWYPLEMQ